MSIDKQTAQTGDHDALTMLSHDDLEVVLAVMMATALDRTLSEEERKIAHDGVHAVVRELSQRERLGGRHEHR